MPLSPGDHLGPYEILSPIGAGGMGEVWKARDTRLDRIVAIKTLKGQHSARFEQEARVIAALNHPHICQIYDIGPDYLVLEYIEGTPLKGPLPADQAWTLARQIASALEAAHAKGILHRDLKPGNILVSASGAKLLDFGLAKLMDDGDATQTIGIAGTPLYMSPEQVEGKPLDTRSDIFSFGVVLYELLTGRRPFDSLASVLRDDPAPSGHGVVTKCLAKQPEQRFDSMTSVLAALREIGTKPVEQKPSIAVLPFANMSRDTDDEYFSDGLAEEIINLLAQIPGLNVIARTSAFAFKGKNEDIRKIAETLGVSTVLEGSIRRVGTRLRITAQLIRAKDGMHLWSQRYDREMTDVFEVQDEVSAAISEALQVKLSPRATAKPRYTPKLPAYEALLKARHFHWQLRPDAMEQAGVLYEQAIALDPQYALAHAAYSNYLFGRTVLSMTPLREAATGIRSAAKRALELDPSLAEAHAMLALLAATSDYDWKEANAQRSAAEAGDSVTPQCLFDCGNSLRYEGRAPEASAKLERAVQGDPLQLTFRVSLAMALGTGGRLAEAEQHLRQAIHLDGKFFVAYTVLAALYGNRGMFAEALTTAEKAFTLAPFFPAVIGSYGGLLVRMGQPERGQEVIRPLGAGEVYGASAGLALFHLCSGETDRAADWFEKAITERDAVAQGMLQGVPGELVRSSPRWPKLAAMMNLPAVS
jgi:eukaryotic-like serine/threonine-protein kinase